MRKNKGTDNDDVLHLIKTVYEKKNIFKKETRKYKNISKQYEIIPYSPELPGFLIILKQTLPTQGNYEK